MLCACGDGNIVHSCYFSLIILIFWTLLYDSCSQGNATVGITLPFVYNVVTKKSLDVISFVFILFFINLTDKQISWAYFNQNFMYKSMEQMSLFMSINEYVFYYKTLY